MAVSKGKVLKGRRRKPKGPPADRPLSKAEFDEALGTLGIVRELVDDAEGLYRASFEEQHPSQQAREVMADFKKLVEARTVSRTDEKYGFWADLFDMVMNARTGAVHGTSPQEQFEVWLTFWATGGARHRQFVNFIEAGTTNAKAARARLLAAIGAPSREEALKLIWLGLKALGEQPGKTPKTTEALVLKHRRRSG